MEEIKKLGLFFLKVLYYFPTTLTLLHQKKLRRKNFEITHRSRGCVAVVRAIRGLSLVLDEFSLSLMNLVINFVSTSGMCCCSIISCTAWNLYHCTVLFCLVIVLKYDYLNELGDAYSHFRISLSLPIRSVIQGLNLSSLQWSKREFSLHSSHVKRSKCIWTLRPRILNRPTKFPPFRTFAEISYCADFIVSVIPCRT